MSSRPPPLPPLYRRHGQPIYSSMAPAEGSVEALQLPSVPFTGYQQEHYPPYGPPAQFAPLNVSFASRPHTYYQFSEFPQTQYLPGPGQLPNAPGQYRAPISTLR